MLDYKDYVYAAYKHRNFSKAARELYVFQPWFSTAIKKTEQELNLLLFDRSTSPISLTEAGRYYIEQVERIYAIEDEMRLHFAQMRADVSVKLRIGSSMFFCTYVLPSLLSDFCDQHPEVRLSLTEGSTNNLTDQLLDGSLDLIFEMEKIDNKMITTVPIETEEVILAVPSGYEINKSLSDYSYTFEEFISSKTDGTEKKPVSLEAFKGEPFLILSDENDLHKRSLQMCRNAGFVPDVKMVLGQLMTAYYLACEGKGVTFIRSSIPEHVVATDDIVFYRLSDPLAVRNIYISYLTNKMTDVQKALVDYIEKGNSNPE